jgi:hypothetical protein
MKRHEQICWKKEMTSPEEVLSEISKKTGIPIEDIVSPSKKRRIADARLNFYRKCHEYGIKDKDVAGIINRKIAAIINGRKTANSVPDLIEQYERYFNEK